MSWNPDTYLAFASERTRPAADLLARVALDKPQWIADLGCGPGNSTALLAGCWPSATVEGVDSSPEMIARARESGVHADWQVHDIAAWNPDRSYDLVFSNATYQWLPDHRALLPRLMRHVAKGGVFAFQVPNNQNAPSHAAMRETAADGPWAAKLKNVRGVFVETPSAYYDILAPHASARAGSIDIWTTDYLHVLEGEDAVFRWVSGTGLRPYLDALAPDERDAFTAQYKARLNAAYPRRADGRTLLPFARLFAIARV
ncbi:MAG: trans-aconitate 2-methyltransferase [Alphaproteobacteria bacterium]|nr:trans-aconitate 2-methyltransferase [Alphaproteobacteria bacterium]